MQPVEIVRELRGHAANLALRMPISWVNILAGPPVVIDGRTLDGRTQWFLKLLIWFCRWKGCFTIWLS